jgi:hypothetical protein
MHGSSATDARRSRKRASRDDEPRTVDLAQSSANGKGGLQLAADRMRSFGGDARVAMSSSTSGGGQHSTVHTICCARNVSICCAS